MMVEAMMKQSLQKIRENVYFRPLLFLAISLVLGTLLSPSFLTIRNIRAILISAAPLMIVATGEAIVVLTGMIDLGVESLLASSGVLMATLDLAYRLPTFVSIPLVLLYGAVIGFVNGTLVARVRIPSFVATLGMYWGLRGLAMIISKGYPISPSSFSPTRPFSFTWIVANLRGFPVMVMIAIAVAVFFHYFALEFKKGREIYAVGGNEVAARNCGINVDSVKIFVFVVSGVLSAMAGIIMTAWIEQAYAWTAQGMSLQAVAAVVLGGIPFIGGFGTVIGVVIGSFIIAMISDLIVLLGISPFYSYVATAVVLVLAGLQVRRGTFAK